jgi:DNA-binding beta-propeller fold protein YncE
MSGQRARELLMSPDVKTRSARWLVIAIMALSASGCASTNSQLPEVFWPDPPDKPRIKFLRSLQSKDDMGGPSVRELLVGNDQTRALYQPMGIAVSTDQQRLYVADHVWNVVFVFDSKAEALRTIGDDQRYPLAMPIGVALDADENVYVTDTGTQSVRVYDKNGVFLRSIGKDLLVHPTGIAIDAARQRLYVVDTGRNDTPQAHRVRIFDLAGTAQQEIGKRGDGDGEFNFPTFANLDSEGRLYVVDSVNNRIQVFDPSGKFLWKFGESGDALGNFARPKGVAIDGYGNIYVVDSRWSNVQMFNQQGQLLMIFAGVGDYPGLLTNPTAIAIDSRNQIYISDTFGKRVSVYELIGTSADDGALVSSRVGNQ